MSEIESPAQAEIRLEASRLGHRLWRNNSGVLFNEVGRPIRFGLCNDSPAMNEQVKSLDLIGLTSTGRFFAVEVKPPSWVFRGSPRERAQLAFIQMVRRMQGVAFFARSVEEFRRHLDEALRDLSC